MPRGRSRAGRDSGASPLGWTFRAAAKIEVVFWKGASSLSSHSGRVVRGNANLDNVILEMKSITKTFPGVKALNNVNLSVKQGEIHALVGENGAGKSTLMNVLSGTYPHGTYTGQIVLEGKECAFREIADSEKQGIVIIHQELALIPYLSIGENIFLRNERARNQVIDWDRTYTEADKLLELVGLKQKLAGGDQGHQRRAAAAGGDRQGAVQEREAADPGRADGLAERGRLREPAQAPPGAQEERADLDPDLAQDPRDHRGR